jgi:hypothetical protein
MTMIITIIITVIISAVNNMTNNHFRNNNTSKNKKNILDVDNYNDDDSAINSSYHNLN